MARSASARSSRRSTRDRRHRSPEASNDDEASRNLRSNTATDSSSASVCAQAGYGGTGTSPSMNSSRSRPSWSIPSGSGAPVEPRRPQPQQQTMDRRGVRGGRAPHVFAHPTHRALIRDAASQHLLPHDRSIPVASTSPTRITQGRAAPSGPFRWNVGSTLIAGDLLLSSQGRHGRVGLSTLAAANGDGSDPRTRLLRRHSQCRIRRLISVCSTSERMMTNPKNS